MARLPSFDQLGERPTPQPNMAVVGYNPNSGAEGAQGQALAQVGARLENEGDRQFQIQKVEQEKTDTIKVEDAWNQYKNHALDLTHGDKGLLKRQGADAVNGNLVNLSAASLADMRKKIAEGLGNDEQRTRFLQRADITDMQTKQSLYSHLATEQKNYAKTVFEGSGANARAQVANDPMSESVFLGEKDTLLRQADQYLDLNGIQDKGTREDLRNKLTDSLLATRLEAMLSMNQPLAAERLFKETRGEIKNPEIRMTYQNRIRAAAIPANASIRASTVFDEVVTQDNDRRAAAPQTPRATPEGGPARTFDTAVASLLKREGGYVARDGDSGAPANFGVNQKFNPDVDVKSLTRAGAIEIYRKRYWDKIDGDNLAADTALVALDAAALQGPEVAKKLIQDTGGDPKAMIALRREQLTALARRDPGKAPNLQGWLNRLTSLEAEVAQMPAFQRVSMADAPLATDTSGMPNSRDVSALLPVMMSRVETNADELYGKDKTNPDRMAFVKQMNTELEGRVRDTVQAFNAIQRQVQGQFIDMAVGLRTGQGTPITPGMQRTGMLTVASIQADPALRQRWDQLDPAAKPMILNLMDKAANDPAKGDPVLYRELYDRINLPEGDPRKVIFPSQVLDPRLSIPQIEHLNNTLKQWTTPGGRSFNQLRTTMDAYVGRQMRNNMLFTAQPDRADQAAMQWSLDAGKKIDEYEKAGKDPRTLFLMDSKDSIVTPAYLQTYVNSTPAQGLASGAAAVAAGAKPPIAGAPVTPPATPRNEQEYNALPPGTIYLDPQGNQRQKPGQAPAAAAVVAAAVPDGQPTGALAVPDGTVITKGAPPAKDITVDDFELVTKPTTVRGQIAAVRKARERAAEIRRLGAQGPQYDITGPLRSLAVGATVVGDAMLAGPAAIGRAAQRAIPTELEAVYAGFDAIKKARKVTMADEGILTETIRYGLLPEADDKLARALLAKIKAKQ